MKKFLTLLLVLSMFAACAVTFTACTKDASGDKKATEQKVDEKKTEDKKAEDKKDVTDDKDVTAEKKVLKMGTNAAFPPYEFKEGEEFKGIDVDIAAALAEELGAKLEIVDMEFDSIIPSVQKGEVDMGIAGMTVTDERKEQVSFSLSYATGVQVVIVPEGSEIASVDDLQGKKIGTQLGTTGDMFSKDDFGEDNVISYSKGSDAVIALKGGDVDAVIIDNQPAKVFVEQNEGLKILETEYVIEDYAIAIAKDNTELLDEINAALEKLTAEGKIDAIIDAYIKAE